VCQSAFCFYNIYLRWSTYKGKKFILAHSFRGLIYDQFTHWFWVFGRVVQHGGSTWHGKILISWLGTEKRGKRGGSIIPFKGMSPVIWRPSPQPPKATSQWFHHFSIAQWAKTTPSAHGWAFVGHNSNCFFSSSSMPSFLSWLEVCKKSDNKNIKHM
jgi:hypothetical protein